MILDITTKPHRLTADSGKKLYDKTAEVKEGEERYYFYVAYVPDFMTLEICQIRYAESWEVLSDDNNP